MAYIALSPRGWRPRASVQYIPYIPRARVITITYSCIFTLSSLPLPQHGAGRAPSGEYSCQPVPTLLLREQGEEDSWYPVCWLGQKGGGTGEGYM